MDLVPAPDDMSVDAYRMVGVAFRPLEHLAMPPDGGCAVDSWDERKRPVCDVQTGLKRSRISVSVRAQVSRSPDMISARVAY